MSPIPKVVVDTLFSFWDPRYQPQLLADGGAGPRTWLIGRVERSPGAEAGRSDLLSHLGVSGRHPAIEKWRGRHHVVRQRTEGNCSLGL